jgi:hypothetical protein
MTCRGFRLVLLALKTGNETDEVKTTVFIGPHNI